MQAPSPAAAPTTTAARKVVTVLFADLTGSTALEERMDAESVRSILDRFYAAMRTEVERHSGRVVKFTGDGVMAAFGVPEVHEDDADRAIDTALAMRTELEELASDLQLDLSLKIGVNTGEVVVSADDDDVVGDAVNVASRLEGAATAGEILVGEDTWRLTRGASRYEPIAPLELKGKSEPVPAYRLLAVDERTADSAAAPFVGREAELGRLLDVFQECVDTKSARLVTIIGSPGLGKTRLARELMAELSDVARVRETRCDPAAAQTFAPIADLMRATNGLSETDTEEVVLDALRARLPVDDEDRDRIAMRAAAILGVGLAGSTEETFWALRRLLEAAASQQPVVLVLDDIHWAEPLLLDLIEHLAEWIRDAPVLLVGTARPELRDLRPSLTEGGRAAAVIALEGLDRQATAQLALNLLETDELPSELLAKIPASTEGNPLFVRELVRMLVDDDVLVRTADGWNVTVNVDAIQVPPTISSLLAARVDRLRSDERTVVELASVVGKEFYRGALVELAPDHVKDLVDGVLESLRRKELVEPVGTYWIDEPVYRFHHVLIRDAAYRRLLKESRAEVHERVAAWLERKTAGVLGEHEELVAYHIEQAADYKKQLGRPDEELARRAATLLGDAAKRALDRDDLPSAAALSERALVALPTGDEERSELLLICCEALLSMSEVARGSLVLDEFESFATTPRLAAWRTCFVEQLANLTSPEHLDETVRSVKEAAETLGSLGDEAGAAKAHIVLATTLARLGRFAECEAALDDAITAARAAGDRRQLTATLGFAPHAALWGPNLVSRAGGRCLDIVRLLRITTGSPAVEATSLRCQAVLEAFRGRSDAARRMLRSARRTITELGLEHELLDTEHFAGIVEIVDGDAAAAIEHLTIAYEGARAAGADVLAAQSAALLARAHLLLGEDDTAQRYVDESERLGSQDLNAAIAGRSVGAELLARRGSFADAARLASEAVDLAGRTDALIDHGWACRALANVLRAAGDADGAKGAEDRALALFERKGAAALLAHPTARPASPVEPTDEPIADVLGTGRHSDSEGVGSVALGALANSATRRIDELYVSFNNGDVDAALANFPDDHMFEDRRSGLPATLIGREEQRRQLAEVVGYGNRVDSTVVAIRGDRLALVLTHWRLARSDFEVSHLTLLDLGDDGRRNHTVVFDEADLGDALAELERRYVAGEGREHERLVRIAQRYLETTRVGDWESFTALLTDDFVMLDHRAASLGELRGLVTLMDALQTYRDLLVSGRTFIVAYHAVGADGGVCQVTEWLTSDHRTRVEVVYHIVGLIRDDRICRVEVFAIEELDAALARFSELTAPTEPRENAASRILRGSTTPIGTDLPVTSATRWGPLINHAQTEGDWAEVARLTAEDVVFEDRRAGLRTLIRGRDEVTEMWKVAIPGTAVRIRSIATRGDRIVLSQSTATMRDGFEVEVLSLREYDEQGRITYTGLFDPDDLVTAFAVLDERFIAGEGAPYAEILDLLRRQLTALAGRDWTAYRAGLWDDSVLVDHRPAGAGSVVGVDAQVAYVRALVELAPDMVVYYPEILALANDRILVSTRALSEADPDAAFELASYRLHVVRNGKYERVEAFAADARDAAVARFGELARRVGPRENAASRAMRQVDRNLISGNPEASRSLYAEDVELYDVRAGVRLTLRGVDARIADMRSAVDVGVRQVETTVVATRGDRLSLHRLVYSGAGPDSYEVEWLSIAELDADGLIKAAYRFDGSNLTGALEFLDERFVVGEGAPYADVLELGSRQRDAMKSGDWATYRSLMDPDVVLVDTRPASLGEIRGLEDVVGAVRALTPLVRDVRPWVRAIHGLTENLVLLEAVASGTSEHGGEVEMAHLRLQQYRDGRTVRIEMFPADALDKARARFEALARFAELGPHADTGWVPMNEALRNTLELNAAFIAQDPNASDQLRSPDMVLEDNRTGLKWRGVDPDAIVERGREYSASYRSTTTTPLATRGEKLGLGRMVLTADFESERLFVQEIDDDGRASYLGFFDPDALDGAFDELDRRYLQGLAGAERTQEEFFVRVRQAYRDRDWTAFRSFMLDDFEHVDHRPAGAGAQPGADAYVAYVQGWVELVPDAQMFVLRLIRVSRDRRLVEQRLRGHTADGTEGERHSLMLFTFGDGKLASVESFDPDQVVDAVARFEELGPQADESRHWAPENTASRLGEQATEYMLARDWDALFATYAPDFRLEERRRGLRSEAVGHEAVREFLEGAADILRAGFTYTRIATFGDCLALGRLTIGDPASDRWTSELLALYELNEEGLVSASITFDADDYASAEAEMSARYLAGEGRFAADVLDVVSAHAEALRDRDWDRCQSFLGDDFVSVDHRLVGAGELVGRERHVEASRALLDLVPDAYFLITEVVRIATDRVLAQHRTLGTSTEGALVEMEAYRLAVVHDGRITRTETFGPEDRDAAIARFDELGPQPDATRRWAPENTAFRAGRDCAHAMVDQRWDRVVDLYASDGRIEDRRSGLRHEAVGTDAILDYLRASASVTRVHMDNRCLAAWGDRIAVARLVVGDPDRDRWTTEFMSLYEVDELGRLVSIVAFDADDVEGAVTELAERYALGEGAAFADIVRLDNEGALLHARRDWAGYAERYAADVVMIDHRPVGAGTIIGRDEQVEYVRMGAEVVPGAHYLWRPEIIAITPNAMLRTLRLMGREEAGADVELVSLNICLWRDGLISHLEQFPADQRDRARARFDELVAREADVHLPSTIATRTAARWTQAYKDQDWDLIRSLYADGYERVDHRTGVRLTGDADQQYGSVREMWNVGFTRFEGTVLATRGERLNLSRGVFKDASDNEVEVLSIVEVDDHGQRLWTANFDRDDLDHAFDVLDERFIAGDGAPFADVLRAEHEALRAHRERDLELQRPRYADDLEVVDHRPASWGSISGIDAWMEHVSAGIDVMPDLALRVVAFHAVAAQGVIRQLLMSGTNSEGGPVEMSFHSVVIWQDGKIARIENFPLERLGDARTRFEELGPH